MIIPIKCFTCGTVIADKYRYYQQEVRKLKFKSEVHGGLSRSLKIGTLTHGYSSVPKAVKKLTDAIAAQAVIKQKIGGTARSTNKRLSVGPISITNDSQFSIAFVEQINTDIEKGLEALQSLKSYTR